MRDMFEKLATPAEQKQWRSYADAAHVIASPWRSPAAEQVYQDSLNFLRRMLAAR